MLHLTLILVSVALAGLRIGGVTNQSFQAGAHMWVAFTMLRAWDYRKTSLGYLYTVLSVGLIGVELACFFRDHFLATP